MMARAFGWFSAILMGLLFCLPQTVAAQARVAVETIVTPEQIRGLIKSWENASSQYHSTLYDQKFNVAVKQKASDLLVARYINQKLPGEFERLDPRIAAVAVRTDVEFVLNRALFTEVTSRFGSRGDFLVALSAGKINRVEIDEMRIEAVLSDSSCGVVPCDPQKCNPDTCAKRSYERSFLQKK